MVLEFLEALFEGVDVLFCFEGADGFSGDLVGVIVIQDKHSFVTTSRGDWVENGRVNGNDVLNFI